jgi:hypothetical protein
MFCLFRGAIDDTKNVLDLEVPVSQSIVDLIGLQTKMSENDIKSLNKAYSCVGRVSTKGGGNFKVFI